MSCEVGRWHCAKCGKMIVAAGSREPSYPGFGAVISPCPWECGAFINRSFRKIKPGQVTAYRADRWDRGELAESAR